MDWNQQAAKVAEWIQSNAHEAHRGAIPRPNGIVVMFSNRGEASSEAARTEIASVRKYVANVKRRQKPFANELGFGVSNDGGAWAMLFRADPQPDDQTPEQWMASVSELLNKMIWTAWWRRQTDVPEDILNCMVAFQQRIARDAMLRMDEIDSTA